MSEKKRYLTKDPKKEKKNIAKKWLVKRQMLVEDEKVTREIKSKQTRLQIEKLKAIIEKTIDKVNDSEGVMELLPDLNLVREIIVATTLSPKDMTQIKLSFTSDNPLVPPEFIETIRQHFTSTYDLESQMSKILSEALVTKGAKVLLPIPAIALQNVMMNSSTALESFTNQRLKDYRFNNIGLIETKPNITEITAMESIAFGNEKVTIPDSGKLTITDNCNYLLTPIIADITQSLKVKKILNNQFGLESFERRNSIEKDVYVKKMYDIVESVIVKEAKVEELGKNMDPILFNLPSESVIPVFVPGEPENHIGYYVILDELGHPVRASKNSNFFKELNDKLENTIVSSGTLVVKSSINMQDTDKDRAANSIRQPIMDAYVTQLEKELRDGVRSGTNGEYVEISKPVELFRLMFARQLEKMQTRALYIPAEMLTYVAFDYDELGIGISLVEKTKLYSSLRAILMFAEIMAGIKNSVPGRILNITLDETDPDPQLTVETVLQEFISLQTSALPLGKLNPAEIVDALQRAGIQVKINGGDVFPNTEIEVEERRRDMAKPDTELSELLKKHQYAGWGVSAELADRGLEGDFATGITQANLLQTKRVMVWQEGFETHLTDHTHKYIYAGGPLNKELQDLYNAIPDLDKKEYSFKDIVDSVKVILPKPDTAIINTQLEAFNSYSAFLDVAIPTHISEDMIRGMLKGDFTPDAIASIQNAIANLLKRQYMRQQNMLPELDELLTNSESNITEAIRSHAEAILKTVGSVIPDIIMKEYKMVDATSQAVMTKIESLKQPADNSSDYDSGTDEGGGEDSGNSNSEGSDFGGNSAGDDELGLGGESGGNPDDVTNTSEEDFGNANSAADDELGLGSTEEVDNAEPSTEGEGGTVAESEFASTETVNDSDIGLEEPSDNKEPKETPPPKEPEVPKETPKSESAKPAESEKEKKSEPKAKDEKPGEEPAKGEKDLTEKNEFGKPVYDKDGKKIKYDDKGNEIKEEPKTEDKK